MLAASLVVASSCARRARVPVAKAVRIGWTQTGMASWYGVPYDGQPAASGEIYDMRQLTAAHPTLPFDTWVEVRDLQNGKAVKVRINDRGPFVDRRIIDLSRAAADEIDLTRAGTARVRLKVIAAPRVVAAAISSGYAVQVGAFSDAARAEAFCKTLSFPQARVTHRDDLWRVLVGAKMTRQSADALAAQIRRLGNQALVVKDEDRR